MITQVELLSNGDYKTYWVTHDRYNGVELTVGKRLVLNEEPTVAYTIGRIFLPLADGTPLPPKSRKGTIFCFIEDEQAQAEADLKAAYPKIYVA